MPSKTKSPFDGLILDEEEQAIEDAIERGEFEESTDFEATKKMLQKAARLHRQLNTTKPVTLRIKQLDLISIKAKAKRNNIPYQTMLGLALHDIAEGKKELTIK